jgi:type I site-specific restriction endonuclease
MSSNNQRSEEIVAVLRQALEALQRCEGRSKADEGDRHRAITSLRAAIASYSQAIARAEQLEAAVAEQHKKQEPVAWLHKETALLRKETNKPKGADWDADHWNPLYTHPQPKREWVGLTDEELKPFCDENYIAYGAYTVDFIKAIEAKLKAKNFA